MLRKHPFWELCFALFLVFGVAATSQPALGQGNEQAERDHYAEVVAKIVECASRGEETVLSATDFKCAEYLKGARQLDQAMPLKVDASRACTDHDDKRVLPARVIKAIANNPNNKIDPTGIRVIGAIFCEPLDLRGLNLRYSLVVDRSIFLRGIDGRSFRISGDLSFDGALVFGELLLTRAHIAGTVFGSKALIQKVEILDSEITGSVLFRYSLFLEPAIFDTVRISGELSLRRSAFPYFLLQFGNVGGVLDLTGSQARCSYQLRTSKVGDLVVDGAGFGRASSAGGTILTLFEWADPNDDLSTLFTAANLNRGITRFKNTPPSPKDVKDALDDQVCGYGLIAAQTVLVISDTMIDAQFCLRDVHWLATTADQAESFVTLNDVTVGATAFVDLTIRRASKPSPVATAKKRFEILGLKAQTLIVNFGDALHLQSYTSLYMNGIGFSQIYAVNSATVQCGYNPDFAQPSSNRLINSVGNVSERRRPLVDQVMSWLNANTAETTQPFSAFVDAFQKNGEISAARELQIKKANAELGSKATRLFYPETTNSGTSTGLGSISSPGQQILQAISAPISFVTTFVGVAFSAILSLLADNGYRPEKVGWFVGLILVLSFAYFWFWEKVIAIRPERKPETPDDLTPRPEKKDLPVGLTFLFDRLLPAYQIREDHYKIAAFLKRVPQGHGKELQYFWMRFYVAPADDATVQRVERALDIMKFLGLVLAIFLVAALNALVSH